MIGALAVSHQAPPPGPKLTTGRGHDPWPTTVQIRCTSANDEAHWRKTTNLMFMHLGIWFFFGYIVHMFVVPLNKIIIPVLGFPLGFYMAAQGSLIVFVVHAVPVREAAGQDRPRIRRRRRRLREE